MKTFQYTIVTVALGGLALVVAPLVSGDSQRAEAKAGPLLLKQAAPVPAPAPVLAAEPPKPVVPPVVPKRTRNLKAADDFFAGPIVYLEINFEPQEWEYL